MRNSINFLTVDCFSFAISLTPLFNEFNNQYSSEKMAKIMASVKYKKSKSS